MAPDHHISDGDRLAEAAAFLECALLATRSLDGRDQDALASVIEVAVTRVRTVIQGADE